MIRNPSHMGRGRFAHVPDIKIERSKFNMDHTIKTTFDSGYLVPILVEEVLPGDTINCRASLFARLATPLKPVMDVMKLETFFFFVPNRLLWTHWEKFCGAQDNPGDSISYTIPQVTVAATGGAPVGSLWDYFGLPSGTQITGPMAVNALYSRAYNLIWNTWFRDENLQSSLTVDSGDGPDTAANYTLKRRGKRHDYFTSCLPSPQKGTAVTIPAGASSAPVTLVPYTTNNNPMIVRIATTDAARLMTDQMGARVTDGAFSTWTGQTGATLDPNSRLVADLSSAFATSINALRLAEQTQVLLERDNRGGTRYTEILRSHFGVTSPDYRLQRPEYLGGGSSDINVHPVAQTTPTPASGTTTPQGNLAAFGTAAAQGHGFNKSFTEHGVILGLVNVRADLTYQAGLDKKFSRQTRYDYMWTAFHHIGEQAVYNREIYFQGDNVAADGNVFGYQERYGEYRRKMSQITGKFRSHYSTPLDMWHLSQKFTSLPTLGDTFIQDTPPIDRVIAVPSEPQFLLDGFFNYTMARPLPTYGVPSLGGRF